MFSTFTGGLTLRDWENKCPSQTARSWREEKKNNGDFESSFPAKEQSPALPSCLPPSKLDSSTQPTDLGLIQPTSLTVFLWIFQPLLSPGPECVSPPCCSSLMSLHLGRTDLGDGPGMSYHPIHSRVNISTSDSSGAWVQQSRSDSNILHLHGGPTCDL